MQQRIERVGNSLIPDFQRALPDSDKTKIHFQFQLVDQPKWDDARTLPGGIILVLRQIVELLTNDSQLAAVPADNISSALEKQGYRLMPANKALAATSLARDIAGFFVPGLSLVTGIATYSSAKSIDAVLVNQSGRVALGLMHDPGYDVHQAPFAW